MAERDPGSTEEWKTHKDMSCKVVKILKMFLFTVHVKQKLLHKTVQNKGITHTPDWDLIKDKVRSHVMAYLVMVHGKFSGVL